MSVWKRAGREGAREVIGRSETGVPASDGLVVAYTVGIDDTVGVLYAVEADELARFTGEMSSVAGVNRIGASFGGGLDKDKRSPAAGDGQRDLAGDITFAAGDKDAGIAEIDGGIDDLVRDTVCKGRVRRVPPERSQASPLAVELQALWISITVKRIGVACVEAGGFGASMPRTMGIRGAVSSRASSFGG